MLQGCAGIGVYVPQSTEVKSENIGKPKGEVLKLDRRYYSSGENKSFKPSSNSSKDIITYSDHFNWCGVFIVVVPAFLPVCSERDTYYFENNKLIKQVKTQVQYSGLMCSILPTTYDACAVH